MDYLSDIEKTRTYAEYNGENEYIHEPWEPRRPLKRQFTRYNFVEENFVEESECISNRMIKLHIVTPYGCSCKKQCKYTQQANQT